MSAAGRIGPRAWSWNARASVLLALLALVVASRLVREQVRAHWDLSEERLAVESEAAKRLLGSLEDVLAVKAYFTGDVAHGPVQIAKRRLLDRLAGFQDLSRGRMELEFADPNTSSEARLEATRLGIQPIRPSGVQGTSVVEQNVYLGLVLRYRGRERVLPFALPQSFEYAFLSELRKLTRSEVPVVGFYEGRDPAQAEYSSFQLARDLCARTYEVRDVEGLREGEPVPEEVELLIVARPFREHPRVAFEIDQYLQRGGRALLLLDHVRTWGRSSEDLRGPTGLERLLRAWGAPIARGHLWDDRRAKEIEIEVARAADAPPDAGTIAYPYWIALEDEDVNIEVPAVSFSGADLFLAHPVLDAGTPEGVERTWLLRSSERAWVTEPTDAAGIDVARLDALRKELIATGEVGRYDLAISLAGRLPSPFAESGAPEPHDPFEAARRAREAEDARARGETPPPAPPAGTTDEPVASAAERAHVVVFGDSDWVASEGIAGERLLTPRNRAVFESVVDWLLLEEDLITLRARRPKERPLVDFLAEERERLGIVELGPSATWEEAGRRTAREEEAARNAARRRLLHVGAATGGAIASVLLLVGAFRAGTRARAGRFGGGGEEP